MPSSVQRSYVCRLLFLSAPTDRLNVDDSISPSLFVQRSHWVLQLGNVWTNWSRSCRAHLSTEWLVEPLPIHLTPPGKLYIYTCPMFQDTSQANMTLSCTDAGSLLTWQHDRKWKELRPNTHSCSHDPTIKCSHDQMLPRSNSWD